MKSKIIQIVLGAVGSLVTVLIQHYATGTADATVTVLGGTGIAAAAGGIVNRII